MAPITDSAVSDLKNLVHKLEVRIAELETKLDGGKSSSGSDAGSMRMILMGPPGAGTSMAVLCVFRTWWVLISTIRKGNTGTEDQGQVLHLPFGMHCPHPFSLKFVGLTARYHRQPVTCCENRSQRRRRWVARPRRSWTRAASSAMRL
jgi:hypothetical protein